MKIKLGSMIKGLFRETLQTIPFIGTIVTNIKTDTKDNPKGQIKLSKWDVYRLVLGLVIGYVLYKGLLTMEQVEGIMSIIGI